MLRSTDMWGNSVKTNTVKMTALPTETLQITKQPKNDTAKSGEMFHTEVSAKGDGLTYRWYFKNKGSSKWMVSSQKDSSYDFVMNAERHGREVYCVITDMWGNSVKTNTVKLTMR